jgi:DNA polymerase/3'-5' exonuclease PolX
MNHALALRLAEHFQRRFAPYCERVEIAGSLRRLKPEVKDIELVVIPKWETRMDNTSLFPSEVRVNLLHEAFEHGVFGTLPGTENQCQLRWIKPGVDAPTPWHIYPDGRYWRGLSEYKAGCKVDIFLTTPERFGCIFAIRTGAGEFSKQLAIHAKRSRLQLGPGGLFRVAEGGRLTFVPTPTEESFFEALGLQWVEPELRVDRGQLYYTKRRTPSARPGGSW